MVIQIAQRKLILIQNNKHDRKNVCDINVLNDNDFVMNAKNSFPCGILKCSITHACDATGCSIYA